MEETRTHNGSGNNMPCGLMVRTAEGWERERNAVALVYERTILTERPPLVGEISANFCGQRVSCGQRDPHGHILGFLDRSHYYFLQAAPQLYSRD
jgi:hypothetical protein